MKQPLLLALLAVATFFYFHNSASPTSAVENTIPAQPARITVAAQAIVIARAPSSYDRWKSGPNAQTDFEPFAPSEQATWNDTPGCTVIAGPGVRRR